MADDTFDLSGTYLQLDDGPAARRVPVDADFWEQITHRPELHGGRLVMVMRYTDDWDSWEMHPAGDELVYALDGAVDLILDEEQGERVVELRGRSGCVVPRGVWHRGVVRSPGDVLHITRGEGTQHRPLDEGSRHGG
jgi:mannose-6-phosphate isomerase-like protein (cupin superfamily)